MLHQFLEENKKEILEMTENKSLELAGQRPSSDQLKKGLPVFYQQLIEVLIREQGNLHSPSEDKASMTKADNENDESAMSRATGHPQEANLAKSAGSHGQELLRLGYTLSHVVHAYGSMCQSITELATLKHADITASEFHDLNRCLDVAIAGAVTEFQENQDTKVQKKEIEHLGFLAHELRNALMTVNVSFQMIKRGSVGAGGSTGKIMEDGLKRMQTLIDQSLTEVRLRVDPKVQVEKIFVLNIVNQINSSTEAFLKNQIIHVSIDPSLCVEADQQLLYSALSNLIQNALKYSHDHAKIQIRGKIVENSVIIEVEDECGGLKDSALELFKPFKQKNENKNGLGLGLTIAEKAILLNKGKIDVQSIPGKGCIFTISLPKCLSRN